MVCEDHCADAGLAQHTVSANTTSQDTNLTEIKKLPVVADAIAIEITAGSRYQQVHAFDAAPWQGGSGECGLGGDDKQRLSGDAGGGVEHLRAIERSGSGAKIQCVGG